MKRNTITCQIQIDADQERVWNAISDANEFGKWFRVKLDGPFVVGEMTTGKMTYPGHEDVPWITVTEAMEAPKKFVFRWPDCAPNESVGANTNWLTVAFSLEARDGGTLVTVEETGFAALPEDRRVSMLRDNTEGWKIQTVNLKQHVEN